MTNIMTEPTPECRLESGAQLVPVGLELNRSVFFSGDESYDEQESKASSSRFMDRNVWRERAESGLLLISYSQDGTAGGFCLSYPKSSPTTKDDCWHIWLVGVLKGARRNGHWKAMLQATIQHAKNHGFSTVSISTFPDKFPAMFASLQKNNFCVDQSSLRGGSGGGKVFLKLNIQDSIL
ncbi:expressed unknown protein [Seminavis robusta]|uniref:N-acetyltransferase domain-containing protein n=1 Tax=Seminavis robusta TaxID=568900 RepID=A0A9N8HIC9_9STRA|nr:expressed unknown protein [Seminavis robusta]|eukprot:Sro773_g200550.1 n/a (180) ;mRNA; f:45193-45732